MNRKYTCPHCSKPASLDSSNPWRPFCSERCRLIDLGDWVSEKNRIPSDEEDFISDIGGEDIQH